MDKISVVNARGSVLLEICREHVTVSKSIFQSFSMNDSSMLKLISNSDFSLCCHLRSDGKVL